MTSNFIEPIYGDSPPTWSMVTLGHLIDNRLAELQTGPFGTTLHASSYRSTGTPVVAVKHIENNRLNHDDLPRIDDETVQRLSRYRLLENDILFGRKGAVDRRALIKAEEVGWLQGSDCIRLRFLDDNIFARFISYVLGTSAYKDWVLRHAGGATMPSLNQEILRLTPLPLPPLPEQRAIAHILGAMDDKIELNRRMNRTLEAMAQALFKSWFVDFDPETAKSEGRTPFGMSVETATLFPAEFVDSEMGLIPKGWRIVAIGDIAHVIDCLHTKKPERQESGGILLQLNNIRDDSLIDLSDIFYISDADYQNWTSHIEASEGDCVITNVGRVGSVAQIPPGLHSALGRNMTAIRCKDNFRFPAFLITCLISEAMREEINLKTDTGTILDALNKKNIPLMRFNLATPPVLIAFEKVMRPLRAQMETNLATSRTLASIRDALLPRLMSGEVRVKSKNE